MIHEIKEDDPSTWPILGVSHLSTPETLLQMRIESLFAEFEAEYRASAGAIAAAARQLGVEPKIRHCVFGGREIYGEVGGEQFSRYYAPVEMRLSLPNGASVAVGFYSLMLHGDDLQTLKLLPEKTFVEFRVGSESECLSLKHENLYSNWMSALGDFQRLLNHLIVRPADADPGLAEASY